MISLTKNITFYEPFPHLIFENVFSDNDYQQLCDSFPKIEFLKQIQNKEISIHKAEKFHLNNTGMLKDFNFFISQNNLSKFLFTDINHKKLYSKKVYRIVNYYISKVSSLKKRSPHILRHSFATHMLNNGADINAIKELLGHSNLSATQIYTHNSIAKLKSVHNQAHPKA